MAVGLGLRKEDIPAFQEDFEKYVRSELSSEDLADKVSYDGMVSVADLGDDFF